MSSFSERLCTKSQAAGSVVCLGIDPRPEAHALTHPSGKASTAEVASAVRDYFAAIIAATHDLVACVKPQAAFFEALGLPGLEALASLLEQARTLGLPVILDAKRGDIGSTAEAYARAYLTDGAFSVDALTVNPFLGLDTLEPFIAAATTGKRGLFVLLRTSNPGSADLQELRLASGEALYKQLGSRLAERAKRIPLGDDGYQLLGVVAGATAPEAIADIRSLLPNALLLVPGYGAQGAGAADVAAAFDENGWGAVVNASRSLTYPESAGAATTLSEVAVAARRATQNMRDDLNDAIAARRA